MTHKVFAIGWILLGNIILYRMGITNVNYYLGLIITLQAGKFGALFPDVDHHWDNVKEKTFVNMIINKFIHLTGGKHRSWQTHSWDICLIVTILGFVVPKLTTLEISDVNREVLSILWVGFSLGWTSHLVSDMLTGEGVRLFCWWKFKVRFVPKKIGKFRFNTGKQWEAFVYKVTRIINVPLGFIAVTYPMLFTPSGQELIIKIKSLIGG
jgi:membrane-bound metal-dependent hydrolase YbcI (DUF457 family)